MVRVGAGIAHDYVNHSSYLNESNSSPFRLTVNLPAGVSLDDPWKDYAGGNPFPYTFNPKNPKFPAFSSFLPLPPDLKPTAQYSWNAGLQRQFSTRVFASATYVGTKIDHLVGAEEQNPALFVPGNCVAGQFGLTAAGPCSTAANINFRRALNLRTPDDIVAATTHRGPISRTSRSTRTSRTRTTTGCCSTRGSTVARNLNFNAELHPVQVPGGRAGRLAQYRCVPPPSAVPEQRLAGHHPGRRPVRAGSPSRVQLDGGGTGRRSSVTRWSMRSPGTGPSRASFKRGVEPP